jgi:hypothetical protein
MTEHLLFISLLMIPLFGITLLAIIDSLKKAMIQGR